MSIDASPTAAPVRERARPLPPDERRSAVLERVIPLLQEHGRDVSTRQIAEACGVAEGTVFRAFGDKETLIAAAVESYFDPRHLRRRSTASTGGCRSSRSSRRSSSCCSTGSPGSSA